MNETAKVTAPKVEKVPEKKPAAKEAVAAPAKKEEVKEIVQHTEEVKETVKKETAKAEEKATAYLGKEINHQDIVKQVKEVWTKQLKKKVGDMKSITIYFKPEENTAYYVINDDVKGSISL